MINNANLPIKVVLMFNQEALSTSEDAIPSPIRTWFAFDPTSVDKAQKYLEENDYATRVVFQPADFEYSYYAEGENELSGEEILVGRDGLEFNCQDESGSYLYYKYCYPSMMFDWNLNDDGLVTMPDVVITSGNGSLIIWYSDVNNEMPESVMKLDLTSINQGEEASVELLNQFAALSNLKDKQFTEVSQGKFAFDGNTYILNNISDLAEVFEFVLVK
ncbi:MAG: hypothetical protein ACTS9Y_01215 [Methylophilus sp.]|uniref:hypothetical protein n=1 Tax=Methylophilus sp. TaxID=29541 RepID=UPI003FA043ED